MTNLTLREVKPEDAAALAGIYSHYVKNTAVSFEYEAPSEEEFRKRIAAITEKYPYLVAELDGEIIGYAYATAFKARPAYQYSVESTIYVNKDKKRSGVGRMLYDELERRLRAQGIHGMYACIAVPEAEDDTLTFDSVRFHEKMGFTMIGTFHECGYKFDRWYNMCWMEKVLR